MIGAAVLTALLLVLTRSAVISDPASGDPAPEAGVSRPLDPHDLAVCRSTVSALFSNELLQVASGRVDGGAATAALITATYQDDPALLGRIQRAEQRLLATAAADLLSRYGMDVVAEVRGYQPRIVTSCARP
ncbi:MAG: hypothetical protein M3Y42_16415 [Actinomycetota bacterium]|nr:hypothetical protein [Actinomycetota bacterium]MDQ2958530.1 hypothetical protein [Actinomycetota bacterium]